MSLDLGFCLQIYILSLDLGSLSGSTFCLCIWFLSLDPGFVSGSGFCLLIWNCLRIHVLVSGSRVCLRIWVQSLDLGLSQSMFCLWIQDVSESGFLSLDLSFVSRYKFCLQVSRLSLDPGFCLQFWISKLQYCLWIWILLLVPVLSSDPDSTAPFC